MNIQELLDHIYEVKDTLSNGLVGQRTNDYANNFNNNLQTIFPALKANPTIDDIVNTGLNVGGIGAIKHLYHATPTGNLQSIAKIGLKPSKSGYEGPGIYFSKLKTGGEGYDFSMPEYSHLRTNAKTMQNIFGDRFKGSLSDAVPDDYGVLNDVRIVSPVPRPAQYFEIEQDGIWKALSEFVNKQKASCSRL